MARNIQKEITDRILAELDKGVIPWRKPWHEYGSGNMPRNAISRNAYKGSNVPLLWITQQQAGYSDCQWLTFKQAQERGGTVRKGEKGTQVTFWKIGTAKDESGEERKTFLLRAYHVFNLEQCDGVDLPSHKPLPVNPGERDALAEEFMRSTSANIRHGENRAYYATNGDFINLPKFENFKGSSEYYATAFHEMTHWTGADHRLKRVFGKRFGDSTYAAEELVAELGSAFLCAEFGFDNDTLENHAAYLASWRKTISENDHLFCKAASEASKAVDYLRSLAIAEPMPLAA